MQQIRAFSYGGGVQSNGALVLSAQVTAGRRDGLTEAEIAARLRALIGRPVDLSDAALVEIVDFPLYLFSNVGDDSEYPETLAYVRDHGRPYAEAHGIEFVELRRTRVRTGEPFPTIYGTVSDPNLNRNLIPFRMSGGKPGGRSCTADWKVGVISRELKRRGATAKNPALSGLGISLDEFHRMRSDSGIPHQRLSYPLVDLRLSRHDCFNIITRAGLPVPPKSSCYFCPFHTLDAWRRLRDQHPDLFAKALEIERANNDRQARNGKEPMWLTRFEKPLDQAVGTAVQFDMFTEELDVCESGYCMV